MTITAAKERPGFAGYAFGLFDDEVTAVRQELERSADHRRCRQGELPGQARQDSGDIAVRCEAQITVSMAESGGRAVERKLTLPIAPDAADDRRQAGLLRPLARRRRQCRFRRGDGRRPTARRSRASRPALRTAPRSRPRYQWYRQNGQWEYEPVKRTERVANGTRRCRRRQAGAAVAAGEMGPLSPGSVDAACRTARSPRCHSMPASTRNRTPTRPTCSKSRSTRRDYKSGDGMNVAVTARTAGRLTLNVFTDRLVASQSQDVKAGTARIKMTVGKDWGTGAYLVATLRRPLDAPAQRMPGRAIGVQWFSIDRAGAHARARHEAAGDAAAELRARRADQARRAYARRGRAHRRGRRRCRHSQSHQLQAAGARRLLSRPAPAHRRDPRSLWATDRRHAGRARANPLGRRRRRGIVRLAADAGAAGALFRHRQVGRRRHRAGDVRYSGLRRHRARDGGGLEQGQGRQGHRRRGGARSGRADRDAAALPAHRRPRRGAA